MIPKFLDQCDTILLMTVHPGFGGQAFMPEVLEKIKFTRDICNQLNIRAGGVTASAGKDEHLPPFDIDVDGGINDRRQNYVLRLERTSLFQGLIYSNKPQLSEGFSLRGAAKLQSLRKMVSSTQIKSWDDISVGTSFIEWNHPLR